MQSLSTFFYKVAYIFIVLSARHFLQCKCTGGEIIKLITLFIVLARHILLFIVVIPLYKGFKNIRVLFFSEQLISLNQYNTYFPTAMYYCTKMPLLK